MTVTLKSVDGAVELQVRDTGVGIPEDELTRVFERFHRIEGTHARTHEGTGIGLALVQELVKLHSGHVRVESAVGRRQHVHVTIPLRQCAYAGGAHSGRAIGRVDGIGADAYVEEAQRWLPDDWSAADVRCLPSWRRVHRRRRRAGGEARN